MIFSEMSTMEAVDEISVSILSTISWNCLTLPVQFQVHEKYSILNLLAH